MKSLLDVPVLGYACRALTFEAITMAPIAAGAAFGWARTHTDVYHGSCQDSFEQVWCNTVPSVHQMVTANVLGALPLTGLIAMGLPFSAKVRENFGTTVAATAGANLIVVPFGFAWAGAHIGAWAIGIEGDHGGIALASFFGSLAVSGFEIATAVALGAVMVTAKNLTLEKMGIVFANACCGDRRRPRPATDLESTSHNAFQMQRMQPSQRAFVEPGPEAEFDNFFNRSFAMHPRQRAPGGVIEQQSAPSEVVVPTLSSEPDVAVQSNLEPTEILAAVAPWGEMPPEYSEAGPSILSQEK